MKTTTHRTEENIYKHISDKNLVSRIQEELQLNKKKINNPIFKGQRYDISLKKTYQGPIST